MAKYDEIEDVHPVAAQWLTQNGYIYKYEAKMPTYGRADFLGTHPDGRQIIVECKAHCKFIKMDILQVLNYCKQFSPPLRPVMVVPRNMVTSRARLLCQSHNIDLVEIDILSRTQKRGWRKQNKTSLLSKALVTLIIEKGYSKVTIGDICACAGIDRTTFSTYFQTKEELLFKSMEEVYDDLVANMEKSTFHNGLLPDGTPVEVIVFKHVQENVDFYRVMLVQPGVAVFINRARHYLAEEFEQDIQACFPDNAIPPQAIKTITNREAGALIGMVCWWLENGLQPAPEEMAHIFYASGHSGIWHTLGLPPPTVDSTYP